MAVVPGEKTELVQTGPYALVRHPIYALSMALMLCSALVIPTLPMIAVAMVHVLFMALKARSEEQSLLDAHGESYADYCRRTGRFFPRLTAAR
jgi:protein-S-isoprenylcysteine O-methyltransferase Ste14